MVPRRPRQQRPPPESFKHQVTADLRDRTLEVRRGDRLVISARRVEDRPHTVEFSFLGGTLHWRAPPRMPGFFQVFEPATQRLVGTFGREKGELVLEAAPQESFVLRDFGEPDDWFFADPAGQVVCCLGRPQRGDRGRGVRSAFFLRDDGSMGELCCAATLFFWISRLAGSSLL